ncbi:MAG: ABC transporter ATP-binding protein [Phycisphaerae bacterium]|nr:ABC transporter ATP-binding protein [Phycisphaerae bacterium]
MLELINIRKEYRSPVEDRSVVVLNDISLKVSEGQSLAIVGPSGSGKSTLLNIIGTLDRPTAGRVLFDDTDLAKLDDRQLAKMRNEQIGFIFQLHHLLPQCSVLENVLIPTLVVKKATSRKAFEQRAVGLLERVGLKDLLYHRPAELSAGQRQRVAVVRALINKPKLLLADEPTGSLDAEASETIAQLLVELNKSENVTLLVVTHSSRLAECMSQVLAIEEGKLVNRKNQE